MPCTQPLPTTNTCKPAAPSSTPLYPAVTPRCCNCKDDVGEPVNQSALVDHDSCATASELPPSHQFSCSIQARHKASTGLAGSSQYPCCYVQPLCTTSPYSHCSFQFFQRASSEL
ncbi:hypothetical protein NL676_032225 [Syzygium grande]|nr:hypothetical protein NL676_032225 [Syzygium grande]